MQKSRWFGPAVIVLALSLAATALAQEGGQQRPRRGGAGFGGFGRLGRGIDKPTLLGLDQVRKELKVDEEQGKKIDGVLADFREARRGSFQRPSQDLSDEERQKLRAERQKKMAELIGKTEKQLAGMLKKEQSKRLDEIELQQQGVDGLAGEYAIKALKLSKETVEKIKAAIQDRNQKQMEAMAGMRRGGGGFNREAFQEIREKNEKTRAETEKAILALLTKEQKEALEKLKGKPFELDRRAMFRGRGGRGGGAGGGAGGGRRRPQANDGTI